MRMRNGLPVAKCCEQGSRHIYFWDSPDVENPEQKWVMVPFYNSEYTTQIFFCPFCGQAVAEMVKLESSKAVCQFSDGGYYCDTCGERLMGCECPMPGTLWGFKPPFVNPFGPLLEEQAKAEEGPAPVLAKEDADLLAACIDDE